MEPDAGIEEAQRLAMAQLAAVAPPAPGAAGGWVALATAGLTGPLSRRATLDWSGDADPGGGGEEPVKGAGELGFACSLFAPAPNR